MTYFQPSIQRDQRPKQRFFFFFNTNLFTERQGNQNPNVRTLKKIHFFLNSVISTYYFQIISLQYIVIIYSSGIYSIISCVAYTLSFQVQHLAFGGDTAQGFVGRTCQQLIIFHVSKMSDGDHIIILNLGTFFFQGTRTSDVEDLPMPLREQP